MSSKDENERYPSFSEITSKIDTGGNRPKPSGQKLTQFINDACSYDYVRPRIDCRNNERERPIGNKLTQFEYHRSAAGVNIESPRPIDAYHRRVGNQHDRIGFKKLPQSYTDFDGVSFDDDNNRRRNEYGRPATITGCRLPEAKYSTESCDRVQSRIIDCHNECDQPRPRSSTPPMTQKYPIFDRTAVAKIDCRRKPTQSK